MHKMVVTAHDVAPCTGNRTLDDNLRTLDPQRVQHLSRDAEPHV